jgi:hypothetical protein
MTCKSLYGGFLLAVLGAISRADDKSGLPADSPPRIVSVVGVKGDVVSYRDFLSMSVIPKASGRPRPGELTPALPSSGPMIARAVEFSLREGKVFDVDGQQLGAEAAKKRLVPGGTVLVSTSGKRVDPAYLRIIEKAAVILVHPPAPPGPPLPGGDK